MQKLLMTGTSGLLGNKIIEFAEDNCDVVSSYNAWALQPNSGKRIISGALCSRKL